MPRLPRVFIAILVGALVIGGVPLGWYRLFAWSDDLMHTASGFAHRVGDRRVAPRSNTRGTPPNWCPVARHHPRNRWHRCALGIAEFAYDRPENTIQGKWDTMFDLVYDTVGATLTTLWLAMGIGA